MDTQAPLPQPASLGAQALPAPTTVVVPVDKPVPVQKHFLAAFFLSFFLGVFGADRFYLGKYVGGVFKLLTFGGFGIVAIVDLALIMNGAMRDSRDRPLVGYEEYKGLAKRTVMWITIGACIFIIVNAVLLFIAVEKAVSQFQSNGGAAGLLGGAGGGTNGSSAGGTTGDPSLDSLLSGGSL